MEIKPLAYTGSLNLKWFILNSTNHKMRSFITSRERKLHKQLHNALCELLWVSHKAVVTHSQNRCKGGRAGQTEPGPLCRRPLHFPWPATDTQSTQRDGNLGKGKFSIYTAHNGASLAVGTLRKKISTTDARVGSSLTKAEVILLTWSFL